MTRQRRSENDGANPRPGDPRRCSPAAAFAAGALRSCGVLLGFVAFGLGWAAWLGPVAASGPSPTYLPAVSSPIPADGDSLWLIDGYNVVCAALLGGSDRGGWWRDEHRQALLERLEHFDEPQAELWVVFDGTNGSDSPHSSEAQRVHTLFAPCADTWLLEQVREHVGRRPVCVATADRKVADRARHRGAEVVSPRRLLERCVG